MKSIEEVVEELEEQISSVQSYLKEHRANIGAVMTSDEVTASTAMMAVLAAYRELLEFILI